MFVRKILVQNDCRDFTCLRHGYGKSQPQGLRTLAPWCLELAYPEYVSSCIVGTGVCTWQGRVDSDRRTDSDKVLRWEL